MPETYREPTCVHITHSLAEADTHCIQNVDRTRGGALDSNKWKSLLKQLRRRLPASAPAEDLLQSAYVRYETYQQTRTVENPDAFLMRTAMNLNIDEIRRRKWIDGNADESVAEKIADPVPLPDEVFAARQRLGLVSQAIDELPQRTRSIFLMHRIDGKKYREIAEREGISQSAVEKHIARAVLFLAERMEICDGDR